MGEMLKGKVAVITGGAVGLGREIALAMHQAGASVVVNDLGATLSGKGEVTSSAADTVVAMINSAGGHAAANYDSVTTLAGGERIVGSAIQHFGRLDILVTCAGIIRDRMLFNMTEEEWDPVIATHLKGTFTCVKPAAAMFRQQRSGRIITVTSTAGLYGNVGQANYSSAKSAIAGLTKAIALDLAPYGATANAISPIAATRMTMTEEYKRALEKRPATTAPSPWSPPVEQLSPGDVAPVVVYLASDQANKINGEVVYVAGGTVSRMLPPRPIRTIHKSGTWSVQDLLEAMPDTLIAAISKPPRAQE